MQNFMMQEKAYFFLIITILNILKITKFNILLKNDSKVSRFSTIIGIFCIIFPNFAK